MNDTAFGNDMGHDNMVDGNMMAAGGAAIAALKTADGKDAGSATVTEADGALHVALTATGLPAGTHPVHIHTTGTCDAPPLEPDRQNVGAGQSESDSVDLGGCRSIKKQQYYQ